MTTLEPIHEPHRATSRRKGTMLKPQTSPTRELVSLDGLWAFALASPDVAEPWAAALDTRLEAPVPASYNDLFTDQGIRDHVGWVWYQRTVRVPRGWAGERVIVRVDAATHEGVVYVDDVKVAEHVGGYLPFEADITDQVTAGEEFRLTIGVNNELTMETIPPGVIEVSADGRPPAEVLPRLLQLRRPRPLGLAREPPRGARRRHHRGHAARRHDGTRRLPGRDRGRRRGAGATRGCLGRRRRGIRRGDRHARGRRRDALAAGRRLPLRPHGRGGRGRRARRQLPPARRHPHARGARRRVPHQRRAVLLHRLRQARGHRRPRQGPRRRLPRARLPAHGLDRRELVPHLALPLRRGGHGVRRPPRHRRDRRDAGRGPQPRPHRRASPAPPS